MIMPYLYIVNIEMLCILLFKVELNHINRKYVTNPGIFETVGVMINKSKNKKIKSYIQT